MQYRRIANAAVLAACALFVLVAYAGPKDFWAVKPYTEWTIKEVERLLLKDSPWTYVLLLTSSSSSVNIGSTGGGGGSKGGGGGGGGGGGASADGPPPIYVNWYARPIREAIVRQTMLMAPETPKQQLDAVLGFKSEFHEVILTGYVPGGMRGGRGGRGASGNADEAMAKFKEGTYLQKKNGQRIPLANLVMPRSRNASIHLQFAKEIDGKPTLTPEEKEVTLVIKINEGSYKYKFKFAEMTINDKVEL